MKTSHQLGVVAERAAVVIRLLRRLVRSINGFLRLSKSGARSKWTLWLVYISAAFFAITLFIAIELRLQRVYTHQIEFNQYLHLDRC